MKTTQTGVEIKLCPTCGYEHPVTRKHCVTCSCPSLFVNPETGLCVQCGQLPYQTSIFQEIQ